MAVFIGGIHPQFATISKGHYMVKSGRNSTNPNIHLTYDTTRKLYRRAKLVVIHNGVEYVAYSKGVKDLIKLALYAHKGQWDYFESELQKYL